MAQAADNGGDVTSPPKKVRAALAKTRSALTRELGELKSRFLGTSRPTKKKEKTVAQKKTKAASSSKKSSTGKKSSAGRSVSKAGTKAKKVVGEMLTGAAVGAVEGAVRGAAQALQPKQGGKKKSGKSEK